MRRERTIQDRSNIYADAVAIVDADYGSDLSLDDVARRIASSRRQVQRVFAEIGETTFRDYLTEVRMERAAALLNDRSLTVREVAHQVGYRQSAQFAKAFRRCQHLGPSEYRHQERIAELA